ncbi:hypothetical protein G7046_g1999 [Stylonectria norvegica]|nr:hypothetical protein G7046_g1999 [Stylonectria norvegica]
MTSDFMKTESASDNIALVDLENTVLESQVTLTSSKAGYLTIFRYATAFDSTLYIASIIACTAAGSATPLIMVFVGSLAGKFSDFLSGTIPTDSFDAAVAHRTLIFVYIGVSQLVVLTGGIYGLNYLGDRITGRLQRAFLDAVLRQNVAFFDNHGAGEIAVSLSNDISLVQDGVSQKVGLIGVGLGGFVSALIVAYVRDWRLALVLLCLPVIIILVMGGLGARMKDFQEKSTTGFAKTGTLEDSLAEPVKNDFMAKLTMGLIVAIIMGVVNAANGLAFWQGSRFLSHGDGDVSATITVLFVSILSGILLGHAAPFAAALAQAGAAASRIFPIIDRISPIDPSSAEGGKLDVTIIENFDLFVPAGKTTAIVRGFVSQDNFLFDTTVLNNIAYGLGTDYEKLGADTVMELVQEAAKVARAHSFIMELAEGYHTKVGERGSRLSGGQRQRVAIARAIVSRPKILLLDEATAALDTKSERLVQEALQGATEGRTTIIIAHRLSTIQKADMIVVIDHGNVLERGSHHDLLRANTTYASLVKAQQLSHNPDGKRKDGGSARDKGVAELEIFSKHAETSPKAKSSVESSLQLISLVWKLNQPERYHILVGMMCSLLAGAGSPANGIFFGNAVIALTNPALSTGGNSLNFWALMYLILGLCLLLVFAVQGYCFAVAGSSLGRRGRTRAFASILGQDMAFFNRQGNSSGALAAFLSVEATKLTGISGNTLSAIANSIMTLVSAVAISCSFGWKLGLVATSMIPILVSCGFLRFWVVAKIESRFKAVTEATAIASEAVSALCTVAALTLETTINRQYAECLWRSQREDLANEFSSAFLFALSQSLPILVNALLFWYGGTKLIATGEYTVQQLFICYITITLAAAAAGTIFSYAPEIAGARGAASRLKDILESMPSIDAAADTGAKADNLLGNIDLQDTSFAYPARPQQIVLQKINLLANPGHMVALVGGSGSGKSTILNLIERFYDPRTGAVLADKQDIRELNVASWRSRIALVEQEAPLIGATIRECLVSEDENISDGDIEQACRSANIHDFVISLPEGYNTGVGARGNRLSGGQKQRIAIAKALLRDPKILLLDEATSALDSESENLVRDALNHASFGRTTISVAHRLSSIAHAQRIYVFDHGSIIEAGSHDELMAKNGKYSELVKLQSMG